MGMGACVSFVLGAGSLLIDAGPLRSQPVCTIDGSVESCEATLIGTALTVVRAEDEVIRARRHAHVGGKDDRGAGGVPEWNLGRGVVFVRCARGDARARARR